MYPSTPTMYPRDLSTRPAWLRRWEKRRHTDLHWVMELFAEMLGVFFYVYAGVGSTAAFVIGGAEGLGSLLQIGLAYAFGIIVAVAVCAGTSGGHFNPAITVGQVVYKGFPPLKAARYIAAQIFGGYIACLLIYVQYHDQITAVNAAMAAKGVLETTMFTPEGTGGIFAFYILPTQHIGRVFLNEFVCDTIIAIAIWACIDPTNFHVPPAAAPWIISFAYALCIWGFAPIGMAANSARDLGGRFMVLTIWGTKASGGRYAAITALTNIPASLFGITLYEMFLADSSRVLTQAHAEHVLSHANHLKGGELPVDRTMRLQHLRNQILSIAESEVTYLLHKTSLW